ncbi:spermidine resistance protein, partial [Ascosphaera aggregata]
MVASSSGLLGIYPVTKYPEARVDAYLFTPCGFSANGVVPAPDNKSGTHYFTVHVTPEPHCSYASFETNVPRGQNGRETHDIIEHVVGIFKPGRFTVTFFEATKEHGCGNTRNGDGEDARARMVKMDRIPGYRRTDRIVHDLDGYDLVFRHYERDNFVGGGPRIGEGKMHMKLNQYLAGGGSLLLTSSVVVTATNQPPLQDVLDTLHDGSSASRYPTDLTRDIPTV